MKTIPLSELFEVKYGVNLELNRMIPDTEGIPFIGRSDKQNGVTGRVQMLENIAPLPAGTLTVAGGGSVLATFLQIEPYYSGRDLYYLTPVERMTDAQKLFYVTCIRANRYRYNYGRQANRTLKSIRVPVLSEIPTWFETVDVNMFAGKDAPLKADPLLGLGDVCQWQQFLYQDLFEIERGRGPRKKDVDGSGLTPFITSIDNNNGLTSMCNSEPIHNGNVISVNRNGSVGEAYYQPLPFCSTEDVHVFNPKFKMTAAIGLFFVTLIRKEKYRFSYGRKWGIERMKKSVIRLPIDAVGQPDWQFMENYVNSLAFSSQIGQPG